MSPDRRKEDAGGIEIKGPGGWGARFFGVDTKTVLLGLLMLLAMGVIAYEWQQDRVTDKDARAGYMEQHKTTQALLGSVIENQKAIIALIHDSQRLTSDSISETTYMLTLDQKRREALRLEMPQSLRRKMNER